MTFITNGFNCFRCMTWVPNGTQHICIPPTPNPTPSPIGWQCPVCKKGNAPWAATCGHCVFNTPTYGATGTAPSA